MNIEKITEELLNYGQKLEQKEYFLVLAHKLATSYYKYFNKTQIMKVVREKNYISAVLSLANIPNLDYKSAYYLNYQEYFTLYINSSSYVTFNLKGMVKKIVLDHELQQIPLITLEEALELLKMNKLEIKQEDIKSLNETQYLKSLIYSYALELLKTNYKDKEYLTRAGMFQNAYHNLITFKNRPFLSSITSPTRN